MEASDLGLFFLRNGNGPVSSTPELVTPPDQPTDSPGDVGVHKPHETRQLQVVWCGQQGMVVRREKHRGMDFDAVFSLRPPEDAQDQLIDLGARAQKRPVLKRGDGYLIEAAGGRKT